MRDLTKTHRTLAFFAAATLVAALLSTAGLRGAAAGPHVQEMRGTWLGFVQAGEDPVQLTSTEITEQDDRRFRGVIDVGGPHVIDGTVSASGKVNYQSKSSGDHMVGKAELHDFGGGAGILDGILVRPLTGDRFIVPCVRVLRAFAPYDGAVAPTGRYVGEMDGGEEISILLLDPPEPVSPTSLGGGVVIVLDGVEHSFQLIGTFGEDGRVIAIGHKATHGHFIMNARLANPPEPVQPSMITGRIEVELGDGSVREADFQAELSRGIVATDGE